MPRRGPYAQITDGMRELVVKAVLNQGQPYRKVAETYGLSKSTVVSIVRCFQRYSIFTTREKGHRPALLNQLQEEAILQMVLNRNDITIREIRRNILGDNTTFAGIQAVSASTINRCLKKHKVTMKKICPVLQARNTPENVQARYRYSRQFLDLQNRGTKFVYLDESGFNLHLRRRMGRNIVGQRATIDVPTNRGGNLSVLVAMTDEGIVYQEVQFGPFNALRFLDSLDEIVRALPGPHTFIMDNAAFHNARTVSQWMEQSGHERLKMPPYSPFLNPVEEIFAQMKVHVRVAAPMNRQSLLDEVQESVNNITAENCKAYIRHAHAFILRCLDRMPILQEE